MKWERSDWAEVLASTGAAAIIGGYVRYSYQGELLPFSKGLMIGGGVLVLASIALGFGGIVKFFSRRSSQLGANTAILSLAVIAILAIVNFVSYRHHKRFDLTSEKLYTLSDQTEKIVGGLSADVNIVRFAKVPPPAELTDLMSEYKNVNSHIKFQNVDPTEKPEVAREYGARHMGDVIVAFGSRKENLELMPEGGLSEEDVTSTILKVTRDKVKMACFVTGHGEKSLSDSGAEGYASVNQGLKKEGYNTNSINLVTENGVPGLCFGHGGIVRSYVDSDIR